MNKMNKLEEELKEINQLIELNEKKNLSTSALLYKKQKLLTKWFSNKYGLPCIINID